MVAKTAQEYGQITEADAQKQINDACKLAADWTLNNVSKKEINNLMSAKTDFMYSSVSGGVDGEFDAAAICDAAFGAATK